MSELEVTDIDQVREAAEGAKHLVQHPVFNQAFRMLNEDLINNILRTPPEAQEERERLYAMYQGGQKFVQQFATLINNLELRTQSEGD